MLTDIPVGLGAGRPLVEPWVDRRSVHQKSRSRTLAARRLVARRLVARRLVARTLVARTLKARPSYRSTIPSTSCRPG